jgi:hypothetical protein
MQKLDSLSSRLLTLSSLVTDVLGFIGLGLRPRLALTAAPEDKLKAIGNTPTRHPL